MTTHSTNIAATPSRSLRDRIDAFMVSFGQGFNAYAERRSRLHIIQALEAKSDVELAEMGLKREDIIRHVFRDLMYC